MPLPDRSEFRMRGSLARDPVYLGDFGSDAAVLSLGSLPSPVLVTDAPATACYDLQAPCIHRGRRAAPDSYGLDY